MNDQNFAEMKPGDKQKFIFEMERKQQLSREEIVRFLKKYRGEHNNEIVYDSGTAVDGEGVYHKKQPSNFVAVANVNGLGKREVWPIGIVAGKGHGPKK